MILKKLFIFLVSFIGLIFLFLAPYHINKVHDVANALPEKAIITHSDFGESEESCWFEMEVSLVKTGRIVKIVDLTPGDMPSCISQEQDIEMLLKLDEIIVHKGKSGSYYVNKGSYFWPVTYGVFWYGWYLWLFISRIKRKNK